MYMRSMRADYRGEGGLVTHNNLLLIFITLQAELSCIQQKKKNALFQPSAVYGQQVNKIASAL